MVARYEGEIWFREDEGGDLVKYTSYKELEEELNFYKKETERLGRLSIELYKQIDNLQPTTLLDK